MQAVGGLDDSLFYEENKVKAELNEQGKPISALIEEKGGVIEASFYL